jgi:pimeloyl-ACP methyl ester carboxylesterase
VVAVGGDLGGPVVQDLALRFPSLVDRIVLFNSPLPFDKERMAGMRTRPAAEAADYFLRQGTDPDGLAAELTSPEQRRRYVATFYTSRFWAHPGAFTTGGSAEVDFHTEPFGDGAKLRASFGAYESTFSPGPGPSRRSSPATPTPRRACSTDRRTTSCTPTSTGWRPPCSPATWARSPPGLRHFVPWEAPGRSSGPSARSARPHRPATGHDHRGGDHGEWRVVMSVPPRESTMYIGLAR